MKHSELRQIIREEISKVLKPKHNYQNSLNEKIQKGDMVLYSYNRTGSHPLSGRNVVVALKVQDITRGGKAVEVYLDGRFRDINMDLVKKTDGDFKDGEEITAKPHYSKDDLEFLKFSTSHT